MSGSYLGKRPGLGMTESMLSQTATYALRAAAYLADRFGTGPIRVDDIAAALAVPRNSLSKTLHALARSGQLRSTRGPHGGFELDRSPDEISLVEIVEAFDPWLARPGRACLLGREACRDDDPCVAHHRWGAVSVQVQSFFRSTTLGDLVRRESVARAG